MIITILHCLIELAGLPGLRIGNLGRGLDLRQRSRDCPRVRPARVRPIMVKIAFAQARRCLGGKSTNRSGLVLAHDLDAAFETQFVGVSPVI